MSRNASNGRNELEGDFLMNAQGEDVVAGIRMTEPISELKTKLPEVYDQFREIARKLEQHYRNMQNMEFTIERGTLWVLQTRDGKRTAQAEVRIAVEMVEEGLISPKEAVHRVKTEQVDFFLHSQLDSRAIKDAKKIAPGLNVSPGAAVGMVAFDADTAERWAKQEEKKVIMVRPETKPDDVHGMLAAKGILTSKGAVPATQPWSRVSSASPRWSESVNWNSTWLQEKWRSATTSSKKAIGSPLMEP